MEGNEYQFEQYVNGLISWLKHIFYKDADWAHDIAHEALAIALENVKNGAVMEGGKAKAYLYAIARNKALQWQYKYGRLDILPEGFDIPDEGEGYWSSKEGREHIRVALAQLSSGEEKILIKRYLEGKTVNETSLELDYTYDSVKAIANRALQKLRSILGESKC